MMERVICPLRHEEEGGDAQRKIKSSKEPNAQPGRSVNLERRTIVNNSATAMVPHSITLFPRFCFTIRQKESP